MKLIVVCGSEKYENEMQKFRDEERAKGNFVMLPEYLGVNITEVDEETKQRISFIQRDRIEQADSLFVWNRGGIVEEPMKWQIYHAAKYNKEIEYLEKSGQISLLVGEERARIGEIATEIGNLFRWKYTKEGFDFWSDVYDRLKRLAADGY